MPHFFHKLGILEYFSPLLIIINNKNYINENFENTLYCNGSIVI